jgi:transposase
MRHVLTDNEWCAIKADAAKQNAGRATGERPVRQRATTSLPLTTLRSFNSRRSGYGCELMSPRPSEVV